MMLKVNREDRKVVQESLRHANSRVALDAYAQAVTPAKRAAQRKVVSLTTRYCFNAREWTFPDYPLRGVYATNCVYEAVTGWDAFEPALTKAEEMAADVIWNCAAEIPEEWYEGDGADSPPHHHLSRIGAEAVSKLARFVAEGCRANGALKRS
jgi:hypothetical protein